MPSSKRKKQQWASEVVWKFVFLLGYFLQYSYVLGHSNDGKVLFPLKDSVENIDKTLEKWKNLGALLPCKWNGVNCEMLNEVILLVYEFIPLDSKGQPNFHKINPNPNDVKLEPHGFSKMPNIDYVEAQGFSTSSIMDCFKANNCSPRRLLQQDEEIPNFPAIAFDTWQPIPLTDYPPKNTSLSYSDNETGKIARKDPLRSFKIYKGGFNVTNIHYWSSAGYTGCWGYFMAVLCILSSISYNILFCWGCIGKLNEDNFGQHKESSKTYTIVSVIFFSLVAIVAAALIYWGNARLDKQLRATAGTLLTAADGVQFEINHALQMVHVASMFPISRQGSSHQFLQACFTLGRVFNKLQKKVKHNRERVYKIFDTVKVALTIVSVILAVVVILGAVGTLGSSRIVLIGTFGLMTLLLFASWILAGVSFSLSNVANDACMIMGEYDRNPVNSSISKFLPCLSKPVATKALGGAKAAIKNLVLQANLAIDWANREELKIAEKNNSTINFFLPRVCDPYGPSPSFNDATCQVGETSFANFAKASMAMNASSIVYKMLPSIFKIVTCNFVKVTFEDILWNHCSPLKKSLTQLWTGFIIASLALMPLQVCCALLIRHKRFQREIFLLRGERNPNNAVVDADFSSEGIRPLTPKAIQQETSGNG